MNPLQVSVEKPSNILRKLTIKVPAATVQKYFDRGLREVQKTAKVKGFRPGQVPIQMIRKFYGEDVRHQVFHNVIDETYKQALQEQKIRAVSQPKIDTPLHKTGEGAHDHSINEGDELTFTAEVEVVPEIEVKNYTGISLTQASTTVTDKDLELVVKNLLDSQSQLLPIEDKAHKAKKGDFIDLEFKGGIVTDTGLDEKPGMSGTRLLEIGSDSLIVGFEDQLIGLKSGETKTFQIPFPKDYFEKDLANKMSEFTVKVNEIKTKKLPDLTDEVAKQLGYEGTEDLKAKAKDHLAREKATESERKIKSDLFQALIEKHKFDVPVSLVQAQTRALAEDVAQNLKRQGFNEAMIQEALTAELESLKKRAENQVRASLLLEAIGKKEGISITPEEIEAELKKTAINMKVEMDKIQEFYTKNPGRLDDLEYRLKEDKVVKYLLEKAKIKTEK